MAGATWLANGSLCIHHVIHAQASHRLGLRTVSGFALRGEHSVCQDAVGALGAGDAGWAALFWLRPGAGCLADAGANAGEAGFADAVGCWQDLRRDESGRGVSQRPLLHNAEKTSISRV